MKDLNNEFGFGTGIYSIPDIAKILRMPYNKVYFWLNKYWDGLFSEIYNNQYSNTLHDKRAINFLTLIEFNVFYQLSKQGLTTKVIAKAHLELSKSGNTPYPFATSKILKNIKTDGKQIYFKESNYVITLDATKQLNFEFISVFFKNLEFANESYAIRYWPIGKRRNIVIDPERRFGQPVITKTNIFPETLYNLYKAGETVEFIAKCYDVKIKDVNDSILYCKVA